jgi:hypothetical protein
MNLLSGLNLSPSSMWMQTAMESPSNNNQFGGLQQLESYLGEAVQTLEDDLSSVSNLLNGLLGGDQGAASYDNIGQAASNSGQATSNTGANCCCSTSSSPPTQDSSAATPCPPATSATATPASSVQPQPLNPLIWQALVAAPQQSPGHGGPGSAGSAAPAAAAAAASSSAPGPCGCPGPGGSGSGSSGD